MQRFFLSIKEYRKHILLIFILLTVFIISPLVPPIGDSATYCYISKTLVSKGELEPCGKPLFILMLSTFYLIFGDKYYLKFLITFSYLLFAVSTFFLYNTFFKDKKNFLAVLMSFSFPIFHFYSLQALPDLIFVVFLNFSFLGYIKFLKSGNKNFLYFSSILSGLSYLLRPQGILIFLAILVHMFKMLRFKKIKNHHLLIFLLIFLLINTPWYIYSKQNDFIYRVNVLKENPKAYLSFELKDNLNADINFSAYIPFQIGNMIRMIILLMFFFSPVILIFTGVSLFKYKIKEEYEALFLLFLVFYIFTHIFLTPALAIRYLMPLTPIFTYFFVRDMDIERKKKLYISIISLQLLLSFMAGIWYFEDRILPLKTKVNMLEESGKWVNENLEKNAKFCVCGLSSSTFRLYSNREVYKDDCRYVVISNYKSCNTKYKSVILLKKFEDKGFYIKIYKVIQ